MYSYEEQVKMAAEAKETALYVKKKLKELEAEIQQDLWVLRAPASLSVCFKRPNDMIVRKYYLSGHSLVPGARENRRNAWHTLFVQDVGTRLFSNSSVSCDVRVRTQHSKLVRII